MPGLVLGSTSCQSALYLSVPWIAGEIICCNPKRQELRVRLGGDSNLSSGSGCGTDSSPSKRFRSLKVNFYLHPLRCLCREPARRSSIAWQYPLRHPCRQLRGTMADWEVQTHTYTGTHTHPGATCPEQLQLLLLSALKRSVSWLCVCASAAAPLPPS